MENSRVVMKAGQSITGYSPVEGFVSLKCAFKVELEQETRRGVERKWPWRQTSITVKSVGQSPM